MREIYVANKFSLFILDLMPKYICHYIFIDVRASLKLPHPCPPGSGDWNHSEVNQGA